MFVTDLDLVPDLSEDEMPDEASIIGQYAGVAWGRADLRDVDPAADGAGAATAG